MGSSVPTEVESCHEGSCNARPLRAPAEVSYRLPTDINRTTRKLVGRSSVDETPIGASMSLEALRIRLRTLHTERAGSKRRVEARKSGRRRLNRSERAIVLERTAGRCHVCGGAIGADPWQADHVLAHSGGGVHSIDNYLPAHALCNNYRWDYWPEEFQVIVKLGVWLRTQIERGTPTGLTAGKAFVAHERRRAARRRTGFNVNNTLASV